MTLRQFQARRCRQLNKNVTGNTKVDSVIFLRDIEIQNCLRVDKYIPFFHIKYLTSGYIIKTTGQFY